MLSMESELLCYNTCIIHSNTLSFPSTTPNRSPTSFFFLSNTYADSKGSHFLICFTTSEKKKEDYRMALSECVRDNLSMPWFSWVSSSASCCCKDVNCRFRWPQKSWCCFSRAAYCCWLLAVISVTTSALSVIRLAWSQMWKSSQNRWCTCIYY